MFRRLFRSRRVREERPKWWLDAEQGCPFQLVGQDNAAGPDDVATDHSITGLGHRCSATAVDDYEGVPWVGKLVPEWPVPEQSFANREEDLSIASSVESIWTLRRRSAATGARDRSSSDSRHGGDPELSHSREPGPSSGLVGAPREPYPRDAVIAKLGLQVTSLDSRSPMSKCYPDRKAVFSGQRSLSMYRDVSEASATTLRIGWPSPSRRKSCAPPAPETGPGSGDHKSSFIAGTDDSKIRNCDSEKDGTREDVSHMFEPHSIEDASFTLLPAETSCLSLAGSACRHLEGLLEKHRSKGSREEVTLGNDGFQGFVRAGDGKSASEKSGDITLDHIEGIHGRLRTTASCTNRGSIIEDRRRRMGLGDFEHLDGAVNTDVPGFGPPTHSHVTGSGDCSEEGGTNRPLATSTPISPREGGVDLLTKSAAVDGSVDDGITGAINSDEAEAFCDDSFGSEATLMAQSWRNTMVVRDTDSEFQRRNAAELGVLNGKREVDPAEGVLAEADFFSGVNLDPNFSSTPITIQKKKLMAPCVNHGSQWDDFDVFEPQTGAKYFDMFEASSARTDVERKSSTMSGEVYESLSTGFASTRATTPSASCPPLSSQSELIPLVESEGPQLSCPSVSSSLDSHVSVSSYCSFLTIGSYDDDAASVNLKSCLANNDTASTSAQLETTSCTFIGSPRNPLSFHSFADRVPSTCETRQDGDGCRPSAEHAQLCQSEGIRDTLCDAVSGGSAISTHFQVLDETADDCCIANTRHVEAVSKGVAPCRAQSPIRKTCCVEAVAEPSQALKSSTSNTSFGETIGEANSHRTTSLTNSSRVEADIKERAGPKISPTGSISNHESGSEVGAYRYNSPKRNTSRAAAASIEEGTCRCTSPAGGSSCVEANPEGELICRTKSPTGNSNRAETVSEGGESCGTKSPAKNHCFDEASREKSSRSVSPARDSIRRETASEEDSTCHSTSQIKDCSPAESVGEEEIPCRSKSASEKSTSEQADSEGEDSGPSRLVTKDIGSEESGSEDEGSSSSPTRNNRAGAISEDEGSDQSSSSVTKSSSERVSEDEGCRPKSPTSPLGEMSSSPPNSPMAAPLPVPPCTPERSNSGSLGSSPFPSQDYQSCRDFLRRLTVTPSDLSYSLSPSFVSFNGSMFPPSPTLDDCGDVFSSYTERCLELDPQLLKELPVLPRSSATEMLTCPELRPLRLGGDSSKEVFTPPSSRPLGQRLKRSGAPMAAASDTDASAAKSADKRDNASSSASASMPELNPSLKGAQASRARNRNRTTIV